jgi:elongation factor Ts
MRMSLEQVKVLREKTGAGVVDAKRALDEARGDMQKALDILKKRGQTKALKKTDRETKEGLVSAYVHSNKKVGSMIKLYCETDFVARNEDFQNLAKDIALHVAALDPRSSEELLGQAFVKDAEKTVKDLVSEAIGKIGENIVIGDFVRYEL